MSPVEPITFQELLRKTIDFFALLLENIKKGILNHWKYPLVLFFIAAGIYFFQARNTKTFYTARAAYTFNFMHKKVFGDLMLYPSELNERHDKRGLARVLKIRPNTAASLLSLSAKNITSSPLHEDFTNARVPFYLHIEVSDSQIVDELQSALTNYLNQDPTTNRFIVKEKADLNKQLSFVMGEIEYLDSLKENLDEDLNQLPLILAKNKENSNERIRLNNRLSNQQAVSLLSPFKVIRISRSSQLWKTALNFGIIWFVLSISITTFLHWYKNVSDEV